MPNLKGPGPGGPHHNAMTVVKPKNTKGTLFRVIGYLAAKKYTIFSVFFFCLISTVVTILGTRVQGIAVDDYIIKGDARGLLMICGILLLMYLVGVGTTYLQSVLMVDIAQRTIAKIRTDLFANFQKLPISFFDTHSSGDLMSRLTNDIDNIGNTLTQSITQLFSGVISVIGILIAMLILSPVMTLISLITIPVMLLVTNGIVKFTRKYFRQQQQNLGEMNGFVEETVSGQKIVKLFDREEKAVEEFEVINEKLRRSGAISQGLSGVMGPSMNLINNLTYLIVAVLGGYLIIKGYPVTVGIVYSFLLYMKNFARPLSEIANLFNTIQSALAGAERVFEIMDEPGEQDEPGACDVEKLKGNISLEHVNFSYIKGKTVLHDANIEVKSGQRIAIVGPTGAGKTTIISLLTRFYDKDSGRILIDGQEIESYTRQGIRKNIGMVLQDTYLFSETVRDNIRYGNLTATDEEVEKAAKMANAHSFIIHLPQGYDTILSDNASNISQGQRQLIAIARAILSDPSVLILDEATSSIDTRTEEKIQDALLTLMENRTSFIIAHRLSTIRSADLILVIDKGRIVERGTHQQLLDADGFYANLYNSQFKTGLAI